jgi:hypothetical protein
MAKVQLEFSGGLELLLHDPKKPTVTLQLAEPLSLRKLIVRVREEHIRERHELFATPQGDV